MSRTMRVFGPRDHFELSDYVLKVDILRVDNRQDPQTTPPTVVFAGAVSAVDWAKELRAGQRANEQTVLDEDEDAPSLPPSHVKNALRPISAASVNACFELDFDRLDGDWSKYDESVESTIRQPVSLGDEHYTFFHEVRICRSDGKFVLVTLESQLPKSYNRITRPWTKTSDVIADQFEYPYTLCVETPVCPDFLLQRLRFPREHNLNGEYPAGEVVIPPFSQVSDVNSCICRLSFDLQPLRWAATKDPDFEATSIERPSALRHCNIEFLFVSEFYECQSETKLRGFVGSRFSTRDQPDHASAGDPAGQPRHASTVSVLNFLNCLVFDNPNSLNVFKEERR
jgi:hypothetical protein